MLNVPLRVSDMLSLVWQDVYNYKTNSFNDHVVIKEKKTGKINKLILNNVAIKGLKNVF